VTPPALDAFVTIGALIVGASVGSFLNVVVARVPAGLSIVRPGSRCPRCLAPIAWHDNLPVVSWLLLRARCRACGAPISARYPLLELAGTAAALLALRRHGLSSAAGAEMAFASLLLALGLIDLDTWLLPHALTWPLLALGVLASALGLSPATLRSSLLGAAVGFGVFAAVAWLGRLLLRKEALGFGDVWLLAGVGAWLGVAAILPVVVLASLQGSVLGVILLLLGRATPGPKPPDPAESPDATERRDPEPGAPAPAEGAGTQPAEGDWVPPRHAVPFGPFLALGALEWLYLADPIAGLVPVLSTFR
jgi:leader peptidase (prepilin peptidase) / N-methyltransferase